MKLRKKFVEEFGSNLGVTTYNIGGDLADWLFRLTLYLILMAIGAGCQVLVGWAFWFYLIVGGVGVAMIVGLYVIAFIAEFGEDRDDGYPGS